MPCMENSQNKSVQFFKSSYHYKVISRPEKNRRGKGLKFPYNNYTSSKFPYGMLLDIRI